MDIEVKGRKYRVKPQPKPVDKSSFWEGKSFEELAKEQGVKPIRDISELYGYWPDDEDFDSFLEAVRSAR